LIADKGAPEIHPTDVNTHDLGINDAVGANVFRAAAEQSPLVAVIMS